MLLNIVNYLHNRRRGEEEGRGKGREGKEYSGTEVSLSLCLLQACFLFLFWYKMEALQQGSLWIPSKQLDGRTASLRLKMVVLTSFKSSGYVSPWLKLGFS